MNENKRLVVEFPGKDEIASKARSNRVMSEAIRLANLTPGEWKLWIDRSAEELGVPRQTLQQIVEETIKSNEKAAREARAEVRRAEARAERQRSAERRKNERDQQRINKESERKLKERHKALSDIAALPAETHEKQLLRLAERTDEDLTILRAELAALLELETADSPAIDWYVDPWPDAVVTSALLSEIISKISEHVIARPHEVVAIALWVVMSWVHEIAKHSVYLVATSAEPDCGKTTLIIELLGRLTPRPFSAVEPTGPSIFHFVDRTKPTLLVDEADTLFIRKPDLRHIFTAAWTKGTKIPRQGRDGTTHWFDPFCPKAVTTIGINLTGPLIGRSIVIKLRPKKKGEKVYEVVDDDAFKNLRRKLARWAADNAVAIKEVKPILPLNFTNRVAANWKLLLAIAELAGGNWPKRAREAAEWLARTGRKPSWGVQLLTVFQAIFVTGQKEILSKEVVAKLTADPTGPWIEYNRGGPITERQVAHLLDQYDIAPCNIGRARLKGYLAKNFVDAFDRYLPRETIRTSAHK